MLLLFACISAAKSKGIYDLYGEEVLKSAGQGVIASAVGTATEQTAAGHYRCHDALQAAHPAAKRTAATSVHVGLPKEARYSLLHWTTTATAAAVDSSCIFASRHFQQQWQLSQWQQSQWHTNNSVGHASRKNHVAATASWAVCF
jgi:hypothetical protein